MIKAIIFDCFGVLTGDNWGSFKEKINNQQISAEASKLNKLYDASKISKQVFLRQVADLTGVKASEIAETLDNETGKNTRVFDLIRSLKDKYKLAILSNVGSDWITSKFLSDEEKKLFDEIIMSFEVGMVKPDHEFYKYACNKLGVKPTETIFIDDIERYCIEAEKLGIKTVVYKNFEQLEKDLEKTLD